MHTWTYVDTLSTIDDDSIIEFQKHTSTSWAGVESIQKPAIIYYCNSYMGGTKKMDSKLYISHF